MNSRVYLGIIAAVLISNILSTRVSGANPALIPQTELPDSISNNQATLNGTITLNGKPARVAFQIREAGKRKRYVGHTPWQKITRGQTNVSFSATVSGLAPDTDYDFRAVALVGSVQRVGLQLTFHSATGQPPPAPVATTEPATNIGVATATMRGTINPNGSTAAAIFEWGTTTNYGNTNLPINVGGGSANVAVQSTLIGLTPGTTYHYRMVARNSGGISHGTDVNFTTLLPCPPSNSVATITNCTEVDLREALSHAATISFDCDGTIVLTSPIDVLCILTLDASGHSVTISGGNSNRLFNVRAGSTLQLRNLTLAEGRLLGTNGISPSTDPLRPGEAGESVEGGGILSWNAMLVLEQCVFTNCSVAGGNGVNGTQRPPGGGGAARGGAISAHGGAIVLSNCIFTGNGASAGFFGSGGFLHDSSPTPGLGVGGSIAATNTAVSLLNCEFRGNAATTRGGAVSLSGASGVLLSDGCLFTGNVALSGGATALEAGTLIVRRSIFSQNSAATFFSYVTPVGGAIAIASGSATVEECDFSGNYSAGAGGRISSPSGFGVAADNAHGGAFAISAGQASIVRSTFRGNAAQGGNGVSLPFNPAIALPGSGSGGAIYSAGVLSLTNCTFALNYAQGGSGPSGYSGNSQGGAIAIAGGSTTVAWSTLASNRVNDTIGDRSQGGGLYQSGGTLALANTILSANSVNTNMNSNAFGTIIDNGHNISSDASANFTAPSSLNNTDPLLGSFGDYGGFTFTFPLLLGSPAIDAADPLSSPATDQRGVVRPQGPAPDIGSFERQ